MIQDLPRDILFEIFLYLPPEDIPQIPRICRRFSILCRNDYFWKRVWSQHVSPVLQTGDVSLRLKFFSLVRELSLSTVNRAG
jgi:hypothetical protein